MQPYPHPYYYKEMIEASESLWQQRRKAHPSLIRSLVSVLANFFIAFGSWLNKTAHTEIDELDRAGVRRRLNEVKQVHVSL